MQTLKGALTQALEKKKIEQLSNYVWKGEKIKEGKNFIQNTELLIDMTPERLKECYAHCDKMLNSEDPKHLGRYHVLEEVYEQINKCNIELLIRYFENIYKHDERRKTYKRMTLTVSLRRVKQQYPEIEDWSTIPINRIDGLCGINESLPVEFQDISISEVIEGCSLSLGSFDKKHLTMTFIAKFGLWFTKAEENEFKGKSNVERLKLAKEKLHLPEKINLKLSDKGLSFHEMRAMLTLPKKVLYSDMTNEQLLTLRDKVLLRYLKEIDSHIFSWKTLQRQITQVAKHNNIDLND